MSPIHLYISKISVSPSHQSLSYDNHIAYIYVCFKDNSLINENDVLS